MKTEHTSVSTTPKILRTRIFDFASIPVISEKTGLSQRVLYDVKVGMTTPGGYFVAAVSKGFPEFKFEDVFYPAEDQTKRKLKR